MKLKPLIYGLSTYIPYGYRLHTQGTGGTVSARYCYSVWLRHLVMAKANGLDTHPGTIAELGPGDSLGIGLAALVSGCDRYYAFDIVPHANTERNLQILDELIELFREKPDIPGEDEFPAVKPYLDSYRFPADILDDARLQAALTPDRLQTIRDSVADTQHPDSVVMYKAPWQGQGNTLHNSVDMIYSQAVLEHVDDLSGTYASMYEWLRPGGFLSHQIDYKSHGTAHTWNGHWRYSDFTWKLIRGKRPYLINREPHAAHAKLIEDAGFTVVNVKRAEMETTCSRDDLAPRFRDMPEEDLTTGSSLIQAAKPAASA